MKSNRHWEVQNLLDMLISGYLTLKKYGLEYLKKALKLAETEEWVIKFYNLKYEIIPQ